MPTDAEVLRRDIVAVCQLLYQRGFIAGTEGNVSALEGPDRLWITPSGHHKGLLQPADLLLIDLQGQVLFGNGHPSSETPMHLALYRCRPDIRAVVHAPPPTGDSPHSRGVSPRTAFAPRGRRSPGRGPNDSVSDAYHVAICQRCRCGHAPCRGSAAGNPWQCRCWLLAPRRLQQDGNRRACGSDPLSGEAPGACPTAVAGGGHRPAGVATELASIPWARWQRTQCARAGVVWQVKG